jgi:hypothetical protein
VTRYDFTYLIASLAVETGIPHSEFINMDRSMLLATLAYMNDKAQRMENASRGQRSR